MKTVKKYISIWWLMSRNAFISVLTRKFTFFMFFFSKIVRFVFFFAFIFFLVNGTGTLAGYTVNQTVFFFLTFNIVEILSQFLFREVYRFRPLIVSGDFDLILVKPINPLFRSLCGGADIIDLATLPPIIVVTYIVGASLNPTSILIAYYVILIINGIVIAAAFYVAVLALGILTTEIDHTVMIFRDISALGRLPINIYKEPLRSFLTFLVPVGIMYSIPAQSLLGLFGPFSILLFCAIGIAAFTLSVKLWNFALRRYTSASS